jgi:hypothetical protein
MNVIKGLDRVILVLSVFLGLFFLIVMPIGLSEEGYPIFNLIVFGVLAGTAAFLITYFGLKGSIRGAKWLVLWILAGFKDDETREDSKGE